MFRLALLAAVLALSQAAQVGFRGGRIVGGDQATEGGYPFMASLKFLGIHLCAGVILDEYAVLTAAHCCDNVIAEAVGGEYDFFTDSNDEQFRNVRLTVSHPDYNSGSFPNDVCVLFTQEGFTFGTGNMTQIQPATLNREFNTTEGTVFTAAGWGTTEVAEEFSWILRDVSLPYVDDELCRTNYGTLVTDSMICAGNFTNGGVGVCSGDSGGPLLDDAMNVVGLTSWGTIDPSCAAAGTPGVFSEIAYFADWIDQTIAENPPLH